MKNFYEATVTKSKLTSTVELMLMPVGQCVAVVMINDNVVHDGLLTVSKSIQVKVKPIDGPIDIKIVMTRQHPEALEVKVVIDGYDIIPLYLAHAKPPTNYLDFNGEWNLHIPNFYPWIHALTGQGWVA
jgi:hypothetical protein